MARVRTGGTRKGWGGWTRKNDERKRERETRRRWYKRMYANANFREESLGKRREKEREKRDEQSGGGKSKSKKKRSLNWRAKKEETIHMCNGSRKDKGIWRRCSLRTLKYYWKRTFALDIELVGYISNKR